MNARNFVNRQFALFIGVPLGQPFEAIAKADDLPAELAGVAPGAPVRLFETVEYRTYRDGEGLWWLGVRTVGAAGWSTISPVAGPLRGERGLRLQAWDGAGAPAGAATGIVLVEAVAVARAARAPGGRAVEDSSVMRLAIGGR